MKRSMRKVDLIVIALSSPLLVGVYEDKILTETFSSQERSSEFLPPLFAKLLEKYDISSITYANGPGSFMAIKVTYLFLQTLHVTHDIEILAALGFAFNNSSPIKAMGKLYFHLENGEIKIKPLAGEKSLEEMKLPLRYEKENYLTDNAPNYVLPAVN